MTDRLLRFEQFTDGTLPGINVLQATQRTIAEHAHDFYELVYIKSGFCLHESEKVSTLLIEGDFFLLAPGIRHKYVGLHTVELTNCIFVESALSEFMHEIQKLPGIGEIFGEGKRSIPLPKLHPDLNGQKHALRLLRGMAEEQTNRGIGWQMKMKCQLACLLADFSRYYETLMSPTGESKLYPNYVMRALQAINANYTDSALTVAEIARNAGVSPDYLSRQFRMLTGVGVQEYLRRFRFAKATELLQNGLSVSDVSRMVGFSSLCHFSREFKKELGVTPTQYAKQNN